MKLEGQYLQNEAKVPRLVSMCVSLGVSRLKLYRFLLACFSQMFLRSAMATAVGVLSQCACGAGRICAASPLLPLLRIFACLPRIPQRITKAVRLGASEEPDDHLDGRAAHGTNPSAAMDRADAIAWPARCVVRF